MNEQKRVSAVFARLVSSRVFWMVVSLLASVLLWLYVTSTEGVIKERTFRNIRINFVGVDELRDADGLVITEQDVTVVDLTLSGLQRDLGKLNASNLSVNVDLSDIQSDGHYTKLIDVVYPSSVNEDDITLVSASAQSVSLTVDRLISRKVDVMGAFTGSTAEGYMAAETLTFDPLVVRISGPKTAVDRVNCAWVSITREGLDETISFDTTYTLLDENGETVDPGAEGITLETDEVNVTLTVLMTKTVSLRAAVIPGGGAVESNAVVRVEPDSIMLAGTAEILDSINQIIVDTVNLANVDPLYEALNRIIPIPNDTVNLSGMTTASVRVEIQGLSTAEFTVPQDQIVVTNVPEGYAAEVITESLAVRIRTTEADLAEIAERNIRIVADLSEIGANTGVFSVSVRISIDGFPDAGTVGEYKVYVQITAA